MEGAEPVSEEGIGCEAVASGKGESNEPDMLSMLHMECMISQENRRRISNKTYLKNVEYSR